MGIYHGIHNFFNHTQIFHIKLVIAVVISLRGWLWMPLLPCAYLHIPNDGWWLVSNAVPERISFQDQVMAVPYAV
jgi:hypothetical protein